MTTTFSNHFIRKTRDSGEAFITLADDAPDWLKAAVREAHLGTLPHDWIYAECQAAVEAFDEGTLTTDEDDDDIHAYADGRVDVYTKQRFAWAAELCLTDTWSEAEAEATDMGLPEETEDRIAAIQYAAIRQIADAMKQACIQAGAATSTDS